MASVEWERSGDRPLPTLVEATAAEKPRSSLPTLPTEARALTEQEPQTATAQEPASAPLPHIAGPRAPDEPVKPNGATDPYEATVERLFALLEQNQAAIAALAQAWRHTRRALELTQAELAYTKRRSRPNG